MAKFTMSILGHYEIPDEQLEVIFGTSDPVVCAEMDAAKSADDLLNCCHEIFVDVTAD